ncbi:hypothetical protein SSS_00531 [Sarcoptes scabiei]|nr:hypothetical protein SSS_00531 [Sarcoptes scabiei]
MLIEHKNERDGFAIDFNSIRHHINLDTQIVNQILSPKFQSKFFYIHSYGANCWFTPSFPLLLENFVKFLIDSIELDREPSPSSLMKFIHEINPTDYGVCCIEDLLDALVKIDATKQQNIKNKQIFLLKNYLVCNYRDPILNNISIVNEMKSMEIQLIKSFLESTNFSINLEEFYRKFKQKIQSKFNLSGYNYFKNANLLMNYSEEKKFKIYFSQANSDYLQLAHDDLKFIAIGKRLISIYYQLSFLYHSLYTDQNHRDGDNLNFIPIPISMIMANYVRHYSKSKLDFHKNLSKNFEILLLKLFQNRIESRMTLIYTRRNCFLYRFNEEWLKKLIRFSWIYIIGCQNFKVQLKNSFEDFHRRFGFNFSLNLFCSEPIKEIFSLRKSKTDGLIIELNSSKQLPAKIILVMLLHESIVGQSSIDQQPFQWSLEQIDSQFYDHFGISMLYSCSNFLDVQKLETIFAEFKWCFRRFDRYNNVFQLDSEVFKSLISFDESIRCNYCESKHDTQSSVLSTNEQNETFDLIDLDIDSSENALYPRFNSTTQPNLL